jgi:hypothetical protein
MHILEDDPDLAGVLQITQTFAPQRSMRTTRR